MLSQILPVLKELSAEPQDPAGVPVAAMNQQVERPASERRGNDLQRFKGFYMKAIARIWP